MKAYLLSIGETAEASLPTVFSAFSCGITGEVSALSVLRVLSSSPSNVTDALLGDLRVCHDLFSGDSDIAFFRTAFTSETVRPDLPGRDELCSGSASSLLLDALRGANMPLSFRTDPDAVEWAFSSLLEDESAPSSRPFVRLRDRIGEDLASGEDVRLMCLCDLCDGFSSGAVSALVRYYRSSFPDNAPFIGMLMLARARGAGEAEQLGAASGALRSFASRNMVRLSDDRETPGADAAWLLSLPSSLIQSEDSWKIVSMESARVLANAFTSANPPSPGLHTREIPGTLSLRALGDEACSAAAFILSSVWCLSDLFPALHQFLDHPNLLRSLAPATRSGLFRRLFRPETGYSVPELPILERTLRVILLEVLSLIRFLPDPLRESAPAGSLWQEGVKVCGRAVTLASEYDVSLQEARDSGVDHVAPVHRVSMEDTEEEKLLRRLDEMADTLKDSLSAREKVLEKLGGFRSRQVLEDCLSRCRIAEVSAREKLALLPSDTPEQRYTLAVQDRRLRMLKAAVARCEKDLQAAKQPETLCRPPAGTPSAPFAGEILTPEMAENCQTLLTASGETADASARYLRDNISSLLFGFTLADNRTLLRNLLSACRQPNPASPLRSLMTGVFSVCGLEVSGLRFPPLGDLPAAPLLPDMAEEGRFYSLSAVSQLQLAPRAEDPTEDKRGLLAMLLLRGYRRRGSGEASVAVDPCLPEDSVLARVYLSSRGVSRAWIVSLCGREHKLPFAILFPELGLEKAFLLPAHRALVPAFAVWFRSDTLSFSDPCPYLCDGDREILTDLTARLRVSLSDSRSLTFSEFLADWRRDMVKNPVEDEDPLLSLRLRISCGLPRLPAWRNELCRVSSFFESFLERDQLCECLLDTDQPFPAARSDFAEDILYTFRGVPFARESEVNLLESTRLPEEEHLLSSLGAECDILLKSSDNYHEALIEGLTELLERYPRASVYSRETAEKLLSQAREPVSDQITELTWPWDTVSASVQTILSECLGPVLGQEALHPFSDRLTVFPARGGEIIGDSLISRICVLLPEENGASGAAAASGNEITESADPQAQGNSGSPAFSADAGNMNNPAFSLSPETGAPVPPVPNAGAENPDASGSGAALVSPDAVLPPLSTSFASALCRLSEGRTLINEGFLRFSRVKDGIRSELTLEGAFTLKLVRVWSDEDTAFLYTHDMPTLALWPSVPFPAGSWKTYFAYAHLPEGFRVSAHFEDGSSRDLDGEGERRVSVVESFPICFTLWKEDSCLGALPNLLPVLETPQTGHWIASLDFGSSATSVVFSSGDNRWPLQGSDPVRTLLRNPALSAELLWQEFLPGVPVAAVLPGAVRIFRNAPFSSQDDLAAENQPLPFRDGSIFLSSSLRDVLDVPAESLYTDLKWTEEKGRSAGLYLHQVMLLTALQARCGGAESLGWRAAIPDEMASGGRENLVQLITSLAWNVSQESGLPLPPKEPPAAFASESSALGAYFRFCAPDDTRGGFLLLDVGADTADISLFLRGRESAVRVVQLPMGIHYMLLPTLLRRPDILAEDFGFLQDQVFQRDLADMIALLREAVHGAPELRKSRYALDAFVADYAFPLHEALARRRMDSVPGRTGALLLLYFSYLMMLSGLVLLQVSGDPGRNDFLPERMSLCLSGRGSGLMESLSPPVKTSLWKMLTMFRNPRVSSLSLLFSAEKKMEIPVGLSCLRDLRTSAPPAAAVPITISIHPEELIPEFLNRFRREFPAEAVLLFPRLYSPDPYAPFTPEGVQLIQEAVQSAFGAESRRPYDALAACLASLLEENLVQNT